MKLWIQIPTIVFLSISSFVFPQQKFLSSKNDFINLSSEYNAKLGSGDLISQISEKIAEYKSSGEEGSIPKIFVIICEKGSPSNTQLNYLSSLGVQSESQSWTPPIDDHPYGYFIAEMPVDRLVDVLKLNGVYKVYSAEDMAMPQNNESDRVLRADDVWQEGWTGAGVKVGVLDSGLDTQPANSDLPSSITVKDYSNYPTLDDDVENHVTGHGTHVTGSVLGRGILSLDNTGNGSGPYKGVAPDADLVFLKIGNDYNGGATENAMINALDAAVNVYRVDVINLSYGLWDAYHDGSGPLDQKVDWCYSKKVPVFLAAGNDGASGRHFSGTVSANSLSDFIKVDVNGADGNSTYLYFNLVWSDGLGTHNDLNYKYYDSNFQEITDVYNFTQTESPEGTESRYSRALFLAPQGNSVYYLRIDNNSANDQDFHIYEKLNDGKVRFDNPDPNYTILSPSTATDGFCVGAFSSRVNWTSVDGLTHSSNQLLNSIVSYSSRGPRIDGLQKPDIVAPGSAIISIRDRDVFTTPDQYWISDDGNINSNANYYVMEGTSMAAPQCAGAAALFLSKNPHATPSDIYNALRTYALNDEFTGTTPNYSYGSGKLDIYAAINQSPLPVELVSFNGVLENDDINLTWETANEINNYGFDVERAFKQNCYNNGSNPTLNLSWEKIGFVRGHGNSNSPKKYSFLDKNISTGTYYYRLKQIDNDGKFKYSKMVNLFKLNEPNGYVLKQNYPNPFNPSTTIKFSFADGIKASLKVYNVLGKEIANLFDGVAEANKEYDLTFNANNLPSGVYFYKLDTDKYSEVKKMILLR